MRGAIEVLGLQKRYGNHQVLQGVSFSVNAGEIFGLLGVNGAGKTTALECIEGLRKYGGGSIAVHGKLGIQLQSATLPDHILGREAIALFARWNRVKADPALLEALGMGELAKKRYGAMSAGQKRRLHLALAMLRDPDILCLDEPTAGLDVEGRAALHALIRQWRDQGKTILLASHDMAEVEALCSRIGILAEGKISFLGTVAELTEKLGKHYTITLKTQGRTERRETDDIGQTLLQLLEQVQAAGETVLDIQVSRGSLEQHFMQIAKGGLP